MVGDTALGHGRPLSTPGTSVYAALRATRWGHRFFTVTLRHPCSPPGASSARLVGRVGAGERSGLAPCAGSFGACKSNVDRSARRHCARCHSASAHLLRPAGSRAAAAMLTQANRAAASAAAARRRRGAGMAVRVGPRRRLRGAAGFRRPAERSRTCFGTRRREGGARGSPAPQLKNAPPRRFARSSRSAQPTFSSTFTYDPASAWAAAGLQERGRDRGLTSRFAVRKTGLNWCAGDAMCNAIYQLPRNRPTASPCSRRA